MRVYVLSAAVYLAGCSATLEDYQDTSPSFNLQEYFQGDVTAWGIVQDYSTKLTRRFCVDIVSTWEGNRGQLHETFYYNDGEQQIRIWKLEVDSQGNVTGTAEDVVGTASGGSSGTSFNWQYTLNVKVGDDYYDFAIDDWMFMMDKDRVMNRSYMKKFGVTLAEISIFFDKTKPIRRCQAS